MAFVASDVESGRLLENYFFCVTCNLSTMYMDFSSILKVVTANSLYKLYLTCVLCHCDAINISERTRILLL